MTTANIIDVSFLRDDSLEQAVRDASDGVLVADVLFVISDWREKTEAWGSPVVFVYRTHDTASYILALIPAAHYSADVPVLLASMSLKECGSRCKKAALCYKDGERGYFTKLAEIDCPVFVAHISNDRRGVRAVRLAGLIRDYLLDTRQNLAEHCPNC
jgi:hypothetical protein